MVQLFTDVVNAEYNDLQKYASFINRVSAKNRNYISAVSNAFIHAQKHTPKSYNEAKAILLHYIKCELLYTKTATEKENITAIDYKELNNVECDEVEHLDLHYIIESEVSTWNFIDKKFFDKYMDFKLNGKRDKHLAEHYNIDLAYTRQKLRNLKGRIKCKI